MRRRWENHDMSSLLARLGAIVSLCVALAHPAAAEVTEVRFARQLGLG
jgi:hypothetical protein